MSKKTFMKCYAAVDVSGVMLAAIAVVFAPDETNARELLRKAIADAKLKDEPFTLREIPMNGAHILWDGDY